MARELLNVGDRIIAITAHGAIQYVAGHNNVVSIGVNQLPGPMGMYLVANIIFEKGPDAIVPLHMAEEIRVLNP